MVDDDPTWRVAPGTETDAGSDGGDGSDGWTSDGSSSGGSGGSSGSSGSTDGGSSSSGGTGAHIPFFMEDFEYSQVGEDDDPWAVPSSGLDVFPSVPGCIQVYQHSCEGSIRSARGDECQSMGPGGYLRDFYSDPECVEFKPYSQVIVPCDEFCGEGGGACEHAMISCGHGMIRSAYCKCQAK